jgi:hypothetical protein
MRPHSGKSLVALLTALQILSPGLARAYRQSGDSTGNAQKATAGATIKLLTDPEGVDFAPFVQSVYISVKRAWFGGMGSAVEKGAKGIVEIQFRIQQDGKVPGDSVKVLASSGPKEYEYAVLNGLRDAAPFDHLPSKFSQPFVELRMTFYYNVPVPKPN